MFQVARERESQKPVSTSNMKLFQNHEVPQSLPGFRFHPTDEELVRFYLRRKVDKKPMRIDHLIRQIDIYKHDPWDLPKAETGGSNEYYFFCKRGRKYRNSIRPNRVTGSGFWKATGIDKPVYDLREEGNGHGCLIGLKKTLVYYRGCAGKGTKTDWMMHEFRLPVANPASSDKCIPHPQEAAEVWTVCRIFKRNANHKRYSGDWRTLPTNPAPIIERRSSKACSSLESNSNHDGYISFNATPPLLCYPGKTNTGNMVDLTHHHVTEKSVQFHTSNQFASMSQRAPSTASSSNIFGDLHDQVEQFACENWDELISVVAFSMDSSHT